ncbi:MAG: T9SS type A sorting domain-containing protein [Ferruginibacter sp.]|nr:T9SS type A sorting domain-containing protein [Chitinophagaceae bacterium]
MSFKRTPLFLFILLVCLLSGCIQKSTNEAGEKEKYDGPAMIAQMEFDRTKDPATGTVPRERLMKALVHTDSLKKILPFQLIAGYGNWTERGPTADAVGPSNGNTRANSGITSGRIRAVMVDAADVTGNTVFIGGVNGGIWKTTDITASPATWTFVNDFFSNMAVTGICQDPTTPAIMYFCTGEWPFNFDAVAGDGIFKSTNGGATWVQLASTTGANFDYCSKILCDASGNVYVSTRSGVYRSINGGTSWTTITPSGLSTSRFSDMEISSTGRLHVSAGQFSTCGYRFTDNPSTVAAGSWTSATSGYPTSTVRIELGCNGNTLYALPSDGIYEIPTIFKSIDGGANWAATTGQPTAGWGSGQVWYNMAVDIDGSGNVIVGTLEPYRSTDGGANWSRIGRWVGLAGQYVHADIHFIKLYGANRILFGCDGGVHYSSDGGTTIRDRNTGLRIKQFFSVAIHPSTTNNFLAGAQDNGSHRFTAAGLATTTEVTGGDGAFVHIDQDEPLFQFTSYVFNQYRRSTNGGTTWSSVNLSLGADGQFINPTDYDDAADIMYCSNTAGTYRRWTDPQTGATNASVSITALNSNIISAVTVSPYTSNRVYFGTENDAGSTRLCYVDNANTIVSGSAGTNISTGLPTNVYTSCIATGTDDQNLMVCYSNYGVQQIWASTNAGTSWTNIDGDLPDMPVRWCMFLPGDNTKAIIATEAGVYLTQAINGASTAWIPSPTFPTVRTDMLQYRPADGLIAAATHGRGLWTQPYYSIMPSTNFLLRGAWNGSKVALQWEYTPLAAGATLEVESSTDATNFVKVGSLSANAGKQYNFNHIPNTNNVFYRIRSNEKNGVIKYSNTVKLFKTGGGTNAEIISLYPNPAEREINVGFSTEKGKFNYSITATDGRLMLRKEEELQFTGNYLRTINITGIAAGNYMLTISNSKQKVSRQFIKK